MPLEIFKDISSWLNLPQPRKLYNESLKPFLRHFIELGILKISKRTFVVELQHSKLDKTVEKKIVQDLKDPCKVKTSIFKVNLIISV